MPAKEVEVIVEEKQDKEVVVELDQDNQPVKPPVPKKEEPKYVRVDELEKERNRFFYTQRKQQEEIEALKKELAQRQTIQPPPPPAAGIDEDDILVQKDWKAAVDKRSAKQAEQVYKNLRQLEQQQTEIQTRQQQETILLENAKREVIEKHPELNDPANEKTLLYQQVIAEKPYYLYNPLGPILVMRDMEDRLRQEGKMVDEPTKTIVEKEVTRRTRTNATAVPQGNGKPTEKYVLTKDDQEYCNANGIKYETYAKMRSMVSKQGGVETR